VVQSYCQAPGIVRKSLFAGEKQRRRIDSKGRIKVVTSVRILGVVALILCVAASRDANCLAQDGASVVINELLASNHQSVKDPQGQYDDWIELHNPTNVPVDVGGMYLTDNADDSTRWQIPTGKPSLTRIAAGGFLVIWADDDVGDTGLHAGFRLSAAGDGLYLYAADGKTLIDHVEYGEQSPDVSYGRVPDGVGPWQFLGFPTPGSTNVSVYAGSVDDLRFSHERGFYDAPFELRVTCDTPGVTIYYTFDGSEPGADTGHGRTGTVYTGPIFVLGTTCIRACAIKEGWKSSRAATHTYIFLDNVVAQTRFPSGFPTTWGGTLADYEMDPDIVNDPRYKDLMRSSLLSIPSMSLVTTKDDMFGAQRGIYANPNRRGELWERPASVEWIYPDGRDSFQSDCGVRIQGGAFREWGLTKKKSFRLLFKSAYGASKLRYPLFGESAVDEFNTITLRAGANDGYAWSDARYTEQYTRDEFGRELQRATGHIAPHGMFVHLYVNGLYWGLYNPVERPDASFSASYYGGDEDQWDAIHVDEVEDGDRNAWNQMVSLCRSAATSQEAYQRLQGNHADGTRDPGRPVLLDVTNYIDYLIVNVWGGNWDWPWKNWWAGRDRSPASTGFKFYTWDYENTIGNNLGRSPLNKNALQNNFSSAGEPHRYLEDNPEYRMLFADRVHRFLLNGGVLTPESLIARYERLSGEVEMAIIGESARWGDEHHGTPLTLEDWYDRDERYNDGRAGRGWILNYYLPQRTGIVLHQFRSAKLYPNVDAPVFYVDGRYQHGGAVATGGEIAMRDADGTIWYTLDGSDPRLPERAASAGADDGLLLVAEDAAKRVFVPSIPINPAWRSSPTFDDSTWTNGTGGVGFERSSGYEQFFDIDVAGSMYGRSTTCYIRIPFDVSQKVLADLPNLALNVRYDDGFIAYLNGVEIARRNFDGEPIWISAANAQNSDLNAVEFEPIDVSAYRNALHAGRNLLAVQALNISSTSSDFLFSATLGAVRSASGGTGGGISPKAVQYTRPLTPGRSVRVMARSLQGSVWSALNEATFSVGPVAENLRISEVMYHPLDPNAEYIELVNIGSETINLNLVSFTDGVDFTFPDVELAPGAHSLVVRDLSAFEAAYGNSRDVAGQYAGSLDNAGEQIELQDAAGQVIQRFRYQDDWYDLTDGAGFSLTVREPRTAGADTLDEKGFWRPSAEAGGSPGYDDAGVVPELGAVVINEILANPGGGVSDWIELYNTTDEAIDLGGWFLSDDADDRMRYEIASGTVLGAGGYLVFEADATFDNADDPGCRVPFGLSRNGETLYLHSGADGVLTGYSVQEKFDASERGVSMGRHRKSTGGYNFVSLSSPTPGTANAQPKVGPVVISEIMYHPADAPQAEYVELLNISDGPVTLYDADLGIPWRFTDDPDDPRIDLRFPADAPITLASGGHLLLVKDSLGFAIAYGDVSGVAMLTWGPGKLPDDGGRIQLSKPGDVADDGTVSWIRVDRVVYSDGSHPEAFGEGIDPWPVEADGRGPSLHRTVPASYGNDPAHWHAATPSPKTPN